MMDKKELIHKTEKPVRSEPLVSLKLGVLLYNASSIFSKKGLVIHIK